MEYWSVVWFSLRIEGMRREEMFREDFLDKIVYKMNDFG